RRFHQHYVLTGARCLVGNGCAEVIPPSVRDGLAEEPVPHQVGGPQVFEVEDIVLAYQRQRRLVVKVPPLATYLLVFAREQTCCLPPPFRALLPGGAPLLRFGELLPPLPVVMGILPRRTVCRHQKHPQSHVYASLAPYLWQRLGGYLDTGERHVPAIG